MTALTVRAGVFPLPLAEENIVGTVEIVQVTNDEDTLVDIARQYDLGYNEMLIANPAVDVWMPKKGTLIVLPNLYMLPDAPREGIVINVAEMRLYYYPKTKKGQQPRVEIFPVSVGRGDWSTPIVTTRVVKKVVDPVWYPPSSIRQEHAAMGDILSEAIYPGENNPLGKYALYLGLSSYLIHGTNKEYGIGMQVTHGCIRLYPEDIERLYHEVPIGTPVRIVNQPYKVGWYQNKLYVEIHPFLEGTTPQQEQESKKMFSQLLADIKHSHPTYQIDWNEIDVLEIEASGLPISLGTEY